MIDNTYSITRNDPDFAVVYMKEKRLLLDALSASVKDSELWRIADKQCRQYEEFGLILSNSPTEFADHNNYEDFLNSIRV